MDYTPIINSLTARAVVGLVLWPRGRAWLGRAFLPLVIGLLSVTPLVMAQVVTIQLPFNPASSLEAVLLRTMPLLLMTLILLVWQYGWRYVILFSVNIALFTLGLHLYFYQPGRSSLLPPVTVLIIQTILILLVWQYGWPYVILFTGGIALFTVGLHLYISQFREAHCCRW